MWTEIWYRNGIYVEIRQTIAQVWLPRYGGIVKRTGKPKQHRFVEVDLLKEGIQRISDLATGRVKGLTEDEFLASLSASPGNTAETDDTSPRHPEH